MQKYCRTLRSFYMLKCSSLYFFICMAAILMCLQREGSGREILNLVMQESAQVDFKNILLNFSEKKNF